jgi:hypothetical protein
MAKARVTKVEIETLSRYTDPTRVRVTKVEIETLTGASIIFPATPPATASSAKTQVVWIR